MLVSDQASSRNTLVSYVSGLLFAIGWWFWIDGVVIFQRDSSTPYPFLYSVPGVVATLAFIIMSALPQGPLFRDSDSYMDESGPRAGYRLAMFITLFCLFGAFMGSILIYSLSPDAANYSGVTIILQNILVPLSSIFFRFARSDNVDDFGAF